MCLINWVEIPRKIGNVEINRIPNIRKCLEAAKNSGKKKLSKTDIPPAKLAVASGVQRNLCRATSGRQQGHSLVVRGPTVVMATEDVTTQKS